MGLYRRGRIWWMSYMVPGLGQRCKSTREVNIRKTWSTALKHAKLPHFPIYDLRHTFVSRLAAAGASPITVAQMLGHASTGIVMTYAKAIDEGRRDAIRKLEAFRESHKEKSSEIQYKEFIQ